MTQTQWENSKVVEPKGYIKSSRRTQKKNTKESRKRDFRRYIRSKHCSLASHKRSWNYANSLFTSLRKIQSTYQTNPHTGLARFKSRPRYANGSSAGQQVSGVVDTYRCTRLQCRGSRDNSHASEIPSRTYWNCFKVQVSFPAPLSVSLINSLLRYNCTKMSRSPKAK